MRAKELIEQINELVEQHGDFVVLDGADRTVSSIEFNTDAGNYYIMNMDPYFT